jgi:CelD/BcsL family acetyltransferase involved in cellulose biosynthesis
MMQTEAASAPMQMKAANPRVGVSQAVYLAKQLSGLPSGLAAVSTVIVEHKVLAVDKAGSVFLSTDAGVHWEGIGRQWSGRAVAVRSQTEVKPSADGGTPQNSFELVNEEGQVWTSLDGRSWELK